MPIDDELLRRIQSEDSRAGVLPRADEIRRWRIEHGLPVDAESLEQVEHADLPAGHWYTPPELERMWALEAAMPVLTSGGIVPVEVDGGVWIAPGFQLKVGVTRDLAHYRQVIAALGLDARTAIEVVRVDRPGAELEAAATRIASDDARLGELGIVLLSCSADPETGAVAAEVIAPSEAAARDALRCYGVPVTVEWSSSESQTGVVPWQAYTVSDDDRTLVVAYLTPSAGTQAGYRLDQDAAQVAIEVLESVRPGPHKPVAARRDVTVALDEPLDERTVIDASTGRPRQQVDAPAA